LLVSIPALLGFPIGANPKTFDLLAPSDTNPRKWLRIYWINQ
jgi:hypothetical protein